MVHNLRINNIRCRDHCSKLIDQSEASILSHDQLSTNEMPALFKVWIQCLEEEWPQLLSQWSSRNEWILLKIDINFQYYRREKRYWDTRKGEGQIKCLKQKLFERTMGQRWKLMPFLVYVDAWDTDESWKLRILWTFVN